MAVRAIFKGAIQSARDFVSTILPTTWMSPLQPLKPFQPPTEPRQFDYQVGYNLFYTPRGTQRYSFQELRQVSKCSQLVRLAIETRIDQLDAIDWAIKAVDEDKDVENDKTAKKITDFFKSPDRIHDWSGWLRMLLEEVFVTDALSIAKQRTVGGELYALEIIDGATIFPIIDENGRRPLPPNPAYQQILKGVPKLDFTSEELLYAVRKSQVNTPYGYSAVEQVIETAYTDIQRAKYQLNYFTDGSVPDAYITAPDGMTPDKILIFEKNLNSLLAGNLAGRRQMPVLLHGMKIDQIKEPPLANEFDEWIWRKIALAFSLPPTPLVKQMNRSQSTSEKERATEEGLHPLMRYVKRLIDRIIAEDFGRPDLEFHWDEEEEHDESELVDIHVKYAESGIKSINEVRAEEGLPPVPGGDLPMVKTATGYVPIDPKEANKLKLELQPPVTDGEGKDGQNSGKQQPEGEKVKKKPTAKSNIYAIH